MPNAENKSQRIKRIVDEYVGKRKSGETLAADDFVATYPDIAEELQKELQMVEALLAAYDKAGVRNHRVVVDGITPDNPRGERLKVRCPECQTTLDVCADTPWTDITCDSCNATFSLIGNDDESQTAGLTNIGQFKLLKRIGMGGFGTVWKAHDKELDRIVAIKLPRKGQLSPLEAEQFLREARTCAQIQHPNIVNVYEVGQHEDQYFIANRFVDGQTLAQQLNGTRHTIRASATMVRTIANALQCAHEAGVIHRDLKPSNILIDSKGEPHITDFGLARRDVGDITMTMDGTVLGTPAYMSPEQATGNAHTADARSDIYSLGVILFRMLTDELPFRGSIATMLNQVIHDDAPSPRRLNNRVPIDLETICLKCMAKRPENRFETAADFRDELDRFLENRPILSRRAGTVSRAVRWCRRRPALAAAIGLIFLSSMVGMLVSSVFLFQSIALKDEAVRRTYYTDINLAQQMFDAGNVIGAKEHLSQYRYPERSDTGLLGFEFNHLWRASTIGCEAEHLCDSRLFCVAVSPDGSYVIASGDNGKLYFFDSNLNLLDCHTGSEEDRIWDVCFADDSNYFYTAHDIGDRNVTTGHQGVLKKWDLRGFKEILAIPFKDQFVRRCQLWNDGKWMTLTTVGSDMTQVNVMVFDIEEGWPDESKPFSSFSMPGRYPYVALAPDNRHLILALPPRLTLLDIESNTSVREYPESKDKKTSFLTAEFTNNGSHFVCSQADDLRTYATQLYETNTGEKVGKPVIFKDGKLGMYEIRILNDHRTIVNAARSDVGVTLLSAESQVTELTSLPTVTFAGHREPIYDLAISPDEQFCFSVSPDKFIKKWSLDANSEPRMLFKADAEEPAWTRMAMSNDGKYIAYANGSFVRIHSVADSNDPFAEYVIQCSQLCFLPNNTLVMCVQEDWNTGQFRCGDLMLWDWGKSKLARKIANLDNAIVGHLRSTPAGQLIHDIGWSKDFYEPVSIVVRNREDGSVAVQFGGKRQGGDGKTHQSNVFDWDFSPDGKMLASCGRERSVIVWETESGKFVRKLPFDDSLSGPSCVAFSSDGKHVAYGQGNGHLSIVRLDSKQSGKDYLSQMAHNENIFKIQFFENCESLVTFCSNGTFKIWDLNSLFRTDQLQLKATFRVPSGRLLDAFLTPDNDYIITQDDKGNVLLWDGSPLK